MNKRTCLVICMALFGSLGLQAFKPKSTGKLPSKKVSKPAKSTGAKPTMASASSSSSSAGSLKVSSGTLPSGMSEYSGGAVGGSGGSTISNAYTVQPKDNPPPYTGKQIVDFMAWLASQGYTTLFDYQGKGNGILDSNLDKIKRGNFGSYAKNKFMPVSHGALNKHQRLYANYLTRGVYKINQSNLRKAIKEGAFESTLLTRRLLVQEFFLGRLAVTMQAMTHGTALRSEQKAFAQMSNTVGKRLKQTRYIRNGVEAVSTAGAVNIEHSKTFSPVDFFVGVIVVNNSKVGIKYGNLAVTGGSVGFLPVPKTSYMNNWSNVSPSSGSGLPSREPMTLGELGGKTGGAIALTPSEDQRTMTIIFSGATYGPESFGKGQMELFFKNFSPWGLIVEVSERGVPTVSGLAKMSPGDYGKYLNLDGSVMFSSSASPTGSTPVKNGSGNVVNSSSGETTSYTLGDIIDAPYNLYRQTYQKSKTGDGKRFISDKYPLGDWVAQGLFNGQLELSSYQQLARALYTPPVYEARAKLNPKTHKMEKVIKTPGKYSYPLFAPQAVALNQKHSSGPGIPQILAEGSGIDWLFLRSLRITKALLSLSGVGTKLLSALDKNGQYLFLRVLEDPNSDIVVHSEGEFGQATDSGSAMQVSGASMLGTWGNKSSTSPVRKKSNKKVHVSGKHKSSILKGDVLYIGRTTKYLPLILTNNAHDIRGHSQQQRGLSIPQEGFLKRLTSRQAYIKGYEKGKQSARIAKRLGHSLQPTHHDATLHKDNKNTILPSPQRGKDGEPNNTTYSTNFNSLGSGSSSSNKFSTGSSASRQQLSSTNPRATNRRSTQSSPAEFNNLDTGRSRNVNVSNVRVGRSSMNRRTIRRRSTQSSSTNFNSLDTSNQSQF